MEIQGKVALVTGGAHRLGKVITLMLARHGANVVVNYNQSDREAAQTVNEAEALGVQGLAIQCDVADRRAVQEMANAVDDRFGGVDILVNGASLFERIDFPTDDIDTWHRVTRISIDGAFHTSNYLVPAMRRRGQGAIVNIIDLSVWFPWPGMTAHAVGKSGLLALTRQLALELAPQIRVNAIAPGPVLPPPSYGDELRARIADRTLLKRWGSPEDVAHAVKYLVEAEYVTGETIAVDGGERYGHRR